ncbi:MAG: MFS transporter [Gammaproteobacteria bacterium]
MKFLVSFSILFRNRNYGFLFIGQVISFMGTMITGVALPYQIYHETHSTLIVGLLGLFQLLPLLVTALIGGVFADRYHRRMLLLITESLLAIGCLLLALNALLPTPHIWVIFLVASIMSGVNGLHRPALESITQQIVDKSDLASVGALSNFKFSIAMIVGPAIGGVLIASYGIFTTFLVDLSTFLISLLALCLMKNIPKPTASHDDSTWLALKTGYRYAISRQELIGTYLVDFVAMIFGMPTALFPAIAASFGGAKVLGLLYSGPAIGAVIISFFSGWTTGVKRHGAAVAISATVWGLAIIGFGFSTHFGIAVFFLAIAGGADAVSGIFRMVMWNETIPNHLRGRLAGIEMISYMSGPRLGDTEAGLVAAAFGVTASVVSGGVLCVVSVAVCCYFLPKFWQYRSKE